MDDFILEHRQRLTREAITARLEEAGHERAAIDATWERLAREQPAGGPPEYNLSTYVWIVYWLCAGLIAAGAVWSLIGGSFAVLLVLWLVAYLCLAFWPARALARGRPSSVLGGIGIALAAPIIFIAIGGGICFGTIALLVGSMGY
jgi:hypothetical protein